MDTIQSTKITQELLISILKEQQEAFMLQDRGLERQVLCEVKNVIDSPLILIITGLRRVGKSTLLSQIANKYLENNYYFVNFEDERLINFTVDNFDLLYETLISLFGEKTFFLFDEIQNVPEWERFVRRLHDQGYKFIITGSNASLLSQELGTRLTGRSIRIDLFPFSFAEYLDFKKVGVVETSALTTKEKGILLKLTTEYIRAGGIPDALKYPQLPIHNTLYDDVLYRDIVARYRIANVKSLKELAFYLISNITTQISYNRLKGSLKLGSINTVKKYIDYLENSWLFFVINKYAYSVKEQQIAAKKIYSIDTGLIKSVGFSFSENQGRLLENLVFLELRRKTQDIYYYKTANNHEVDFFLPKDNVAIQVAQHLDHGSTRERELRSLIELSAEQENRPQLYIITLRDKETIKVGDVEVEVIPLYEWLLKDWYVGEW